MAYCLSTADNVTAMIAAQIGHLQRDKQSTMLVVPFRVLNTQDEIIKALDGVHGFLRRATSDPDDVVGHFNFAAVRTVCDALRDLESSGTYVHELVAMAESLAPTHIEGKTVRLSTMFGPAIVDKAKFAEKSGLPLEAGASVFTVFLYRVADLIERGLQRWVIVAVRQSIPQSQPLPNDNLDAIFSKLEERGKNGFETYATFTVTGIADGWQLKEHRRFTELIGAIRPNYGYVITKTGDGLTIPY